MANLKKSLDYFAFSVDFFIDRKIKRLQSAFAEKGLIIYIFILTEIYRNDGYFLVWDSDYPEDIAGALFGDSSKANLVSEVVNHCVNKFRLFDKELFDSQMILTSKGIQRRYLASKEGIYKKSLDVIKLIPKFRLIGDDFEFLETSAEIGDNRRKSETSANIGDNRREINRIEIKEIEENKNIIPPISPQGDVPKTTKRFTRPTIDEIKQYCSERNNTVDPQKFLDYYESNGWKVGKNSMKDWKAAVRTWERNTFSVKQLKTSFNENDVLKEFLNGK